MINPPTNELDIKITCLIVEKSSQDYKKEVARKEATIQRTIDELRLYPSQRSLTLRIFDWFEDFSSNLCRRS